ncbi:hypothetical protein CLAIMM_14273, partial [Cladophialophora immunda]
REEDDDGEDAGRTEAALRHIYRLSGTRQEEEEQEARGEKSQKPAAVAEVGKAMLPPFALRRWSRHARCNARALLAISDPIERLDRAYKCSFVLLNFCPPLYGPPDSGRLDRPRVCVDDNSCKGERG